MTSSTRTEQQAGRPRSLSAAHLAAVWRIWWDEAVRARLAIVRHIPLGGAGLVVALTVVSLLIGVLPVVFVVASSVLIGRVPGVVAGGVGSAAWDTLVAAFAFAAAAFLAQQLLVPVQTALGELLTRRVDGRVQEHMMEIALRSTGIGPLEDPEALDALSEATNHIERGWQTAGSACAGMIALLGRYARLLGFVALVALVASPAAGLALGVATMIFRYGQRGGMRKYGQVWGRIMARIRRADYLRDIGVGPTAAKELRVFELTGWLTGAYSDAYRGWLGTLWAERRRIFLWPYLGYTALGLAVAAWVLLIVARGGAADDISLTELSLGLQATVAALLLGEHYPEADLQTNSGIRGVRALEKFEAVVDASDEYGAAQRGAEQREPSSQPLRSDLAGLPRRSVHYRSVSFHYPGSARPVLDGLDLELPAGLCTAVVGVNGAGKTTLVKLLTRLYEPTAGSIEVDGIDIREATAEAWRRQVSVIFQDFVRYELSVADNIALGAPDAERSSQAVRAAAERAGILDALDGLPRGLDTPLARAYTGGAELSGGQWQRVAIARALFALDAGARVLVMDEPTSALDVRAEARFFDRFVALTRGVTSVLISHRLSSVRRADRIVVLDGGRIVEQGTHEELLAAKGHYSTLFRLQAQRFTEGADAEDDDVRPDRCAPSGSQR